MRTFPPAFTTALARRDGAALIWLLRFTAGGQDYVLCQDAITITPWSITALPLIASWRALTEGVSNILDDYRIADLSIDLINDPSASPSLRTRAKARQLHGISVSIYLWIDGCTDPPQEIYRFRVRDIDLPTESQVNLELQDESIRFENYFPGTVVTRADYPNTDPDDVGKTMPFVFGTISKSLTLAIDAGIMTCLAVAVATTTQTTFTVSDVTGITVGMVMQIDDERVYVSNVSGAVLTVTRGYDGTLGAIHAKAGQIWEWKLEFVYVAADRPISAINKVFGTVGEAILDITPICTLYPTGNHPNYPGRAVISIPGFITIAQAISLGLVDTIGVSDTISVHDTISTADGGHYNTLTSTTISDGSTNTPLKNSGTTSGYQCRSVFAVLPNTAAGNRSGVVLNVAAAFSSSYTYDIGLNLCNDSNGRVYTLYSENGIAGAKNVNYTFYLPAQYVSYNRVEAVICSSNVSITVELQGVSRTITQYSSSAYAGSANVSKTGTASKTGSATKIGTVTASGNSTANTLIADAILADLTSAITAPQDVIGAILGTPCQVIGQLPSGYAFNGQINTSRAALEWCHDMARQCRSYFRWILGTPTLIVRPDVLTPVKSINEIRLSNGEMIHGQKLTDVNDVINTINLKYNRDWSGRSSSDPYQSTLTVTNADSITAYGTRERPELFKFDFVTSDTMAASLLAFYLAWYPWQRWQHTQEAYMFEAAALEFADAVTLAFLDGEVGECTEVGFNPGNGTNIDKIQLIVIE